MTYRKFKADNLFTGHEMKDGPGVLVTTESGVVQAIISVDDAGEDVERFEGVLCPGFVNCHCHLELSHLKGVIPERTGLVDFLLAVMGQRGASDKPQAASGGRGMQAGAGISAGAGDGAETGDGAASHAERVKEAITAAEEAMLDEGIVAVGDICNTTDSIAQKTAGRLYYHNFIEAIGFTEAGASVRFESSRAVFNAFAQAYNLPIETNSLVPHAPYSVSPGLFGLIANFPGNHLLTIHNQESEAENEFLRTGKGEFTRLYAALGIDTSFFHGTGKNSLETYLPHFYRNQTLILVHNVAIGEGDIRELQAGEGELQAASYKLQAGQKGGDLSGKGRPTLFFCLCPNANLYISGQLPDPELLIRHGCSIVVGTDSLASNHQLSILEELKTLQRHFPQLRTPGLLEWATINGARALQLDTVLGSFSPGKQPGVLLIDYMEGGRFSERSRVKRLL